MIEVLAWPAAVVVLGLVAMGVFRPAIIRLLDRTKRVSKAGLETAEPQQLLAPVEQPDPLQAFMQSYDNPLIRELEAAIRAELQERGLAEPAAAEKALIRSLAGTQAHLFFERAQSLIWASQVAALLWLNSRGAEPADQLRVFYAEAKARDPEFYSNYSFDAWVGFLASMGLITGRDNEYSITVAGREYLKWRIDSGRAGPFRG